MKQFIKSKKGIVALLATTTIVAFAAVGAYAYFTANGSGSGSATVGAPSNALVLHGATAGPLYPGGPAQAVSFTVDNPSSGDLHVGTIHLAGVATGVPGCNAADFTMPDVVVNQNVAKGASITPSATGQLSMADNGNQDACMNAALTLNLTSN